MGNHSTLGLSTVYLRCCTSNRLQVNADCSGWACIPGNIITRYCVISFKEGFCVCCSLVCWSFFQNVFVFAENYWNLWNLKRRILLLDSNQWRHTYNELLWELCSWSTHMNGVSWCHKSVKHFQPFWKTASSSEYQGVCLTSTIAKSWRDTILHLKCSVNDKTIFYLNYSIQFYLYYAFLFV